MLARPRTFALFVRRYFAIPFAKILLTNHPSGNKLGENLSWNADGDCGFGQFNRYNLRGRLELASSQRANRIRLRPKTIGPIARQLTDYVGQASRRYHS
jgi:hypothetical protein